MHPTIAADRGSAADSRTGLAEAESLSYRAYLWRQRWLIGVWLGLTGLIATAVELLVNPADRLVAIIPTGVGLTVLGTRLVTKYEQSLFAGFARMYGYRYQRNGQPIRTSATIFGYGHRNVFDNVVSGICQGRPFALCKFTYGYVDGTVRYHASENNSQYLMMAVAFDGTFPSFLLLPMLSLGFATGAAQSNERREWEIGEYTQVLALEGDFGKTFQVRIQPNTQVAVLALLAPDLMQLLLNLKGHVIELASDGTLYVYRTFEGGFSEQDLIEIVSMVETLIPKLSRYAVQQHRVQDANGSGPHGDASQSGQVVPNVVPSNHSEH